MLLGYFVQSATINDMFDHFQKAALPRHDELGANRCVQMSYSYHGDIVVSPWSGSLEEGPSVDGARFGFAHGSDATILAAMVGYLRRAKQSEDDVRKVMLEAGAEVLSSKESSRSYDSFTGGMLSSIATGEASHYYNEESMGLHALAAPITQVPGTLEEVGGTALYTRGDPPLLVFAQYPLAKESPVTAEFCQNDIPIMAKLACGLALGDYRKDIRKFLLREFVGDEED
ncbi:MAG: hypothetical protein UY35_C0027G0007 [Candidatus Saccharibacteria bacterium GW2011_GWC2_48_9]|nr:MAG: hypothetical protein UY35_C0027G0007 [Candidatus Saccharibacteria bacterium GW2011_GWC2_48_9]HCH34816.1 hypothetical protein [Candidatus Saccharibacteria bacterium]